MTEFGIPARANKSVWVRSPRGGETQRVRKGGDPVRQGYLLACVAGLFVEQALEIVSPINGIIIGHATLPVVHQGDAMFASEPEGFAESLLDRDEVV